MSGTQPCLRFGALHGRSSVILSVRTLRTMNRISTLPAGCKNLSDMVRVIDTHGVAFAPMTLAKAQTLAAQHRAELVHLATGRGMRIFRLVDDTLLRKLRRRKT